MAETAAEFVQGIWDRRPGHQFSREKHHLAGKGIIVEEFKHKESTPAVLKHMLVFYPKSEHAQELAEIYYKNLLMREREYDYPFSMGLLRLETDHQERQMTIPYMVTNFSSQGGARRGLLTAYGGFRYRLWEHVFKMAGQSGIQRVRFKLALEADGRVLAPANLEAFRKEAEKAGFEVKEPVGFPAKKTGYLIATWKQAAP